MHNWSCETNSTLREFEMRMTLALQVSTIARCHTASDGSKNCLREDSSTLASCRLVLAIHLDEQMGDSRWRCHIHDQVIDQIEAYNLGTNSRRSSSVGPRSSSGISDVNAPNLRFSQSRGFNMERLPPRRHRGGEASTQFDRLAYQHGNVVNEQDQMDLISNDYPKGRRRPSSVTSMNTLLAAELLSSHNETEAPRFRGTPNPLPCQYCPSVFRGDDRITNRKRHVGETHEGRPRLLCPQCDKSFVRRSSIKRHREKDHPRQT